MTLIDRIRDLIASGRTEQSLDELYQFVKENNADTIDHLVMLQNRMKTLQRNVQIGTMDDEAEARERARINDAILKLLPQLTPEYLSQFNRPAAMAKPRVNNNNRIYLIAGGAVLLLVILVALLRGGGDETQSDSMQANNETSDMQQDQTETADVQQEQTEAATPAASPISGTLLEKVLAEHNNQAVWEPYTPTDGLPDYFVVQEDMQTCVEMVEGAAVNSHVIQEITSAYIQLYHSRSESKMRIGATRIERYDYETDTWSFVVSGNWITPK